MEISIITVFGSYNHGSYLQALNLSKALSKYGNVQFIDYNTRQWNAFRTAYRRTKLFLRSSGQYNKFAKIACFEIREAMIIKKLWKKTVHSDKFSGDVCVLGSDEIWNIKRSVCRYPVYWGDGIACPKIAYAPSINNSTDVEFEKNAQYITYLNNIDSISVRDRHSQEVLSRYTKKRIAGVLDPTLLFDAEKVEFQNEREYIAVYSFIGQIPKEAQQKLITFARKNNLDLIATGQTVTWCDKTLHSREGNPFSVYKNAKYVVTSTFHGTAYAINYRKNFIAFAKGNQKIKALLSQFGLSDREAHHSDDIEMLFNSEIDWQSVNQRLAELRKESFDYLEKAFESLDVSKE